MFTCRPAPLHAAYSCALGILLLLGGGIALHPLSAGLRRAEQDAGLHFPAPDFRRTDVLAQNLAVFSLGGLRSLAAELLALDATHAWLRQDWPLARERWQQITTLCPHRVNYWIRASRDMAKNAVAHVNSRPGLSPTERAQQVKDYLDSAEAFLTEGIANNPKSALLWLELAAFDEDLTRRPRFSRAVEDYRKALALGASPMYRRWEFYNLCRLRGREQEAWALGCQLFRQERHRTPSVRCLLWVLQHKLGLRQWSNEQLFGSEARARRDLARFRRNDLRFPTSGIAAFLNTPSS